MLYQVKKSPPGSYRFHCFVLVSLSVALMYCGR